LNSNLIISDQVSDVTFIVEIKYLNLYHNLS